MDDYSLLLKFAVLAAGLTILPGSDSAIVLRAGLLNGRRAAGRTAAGVVAGLFVWGAAVALAVATTADLLPSVFGWLRWLGVGYLVWLSISLLRGRSHPDADPSTQFELGFKQGLLTNILNPKVGLFYLATVPLFLPTAMPKVLGGLTLASIHAVESWLWLSLLGWFGNRLSVAGNPKRERQIDYVIATLLLLAAAALAKG